FCGCPTARQGVVSPNVAKCLLRCNKPLGGITRADSFRHGYRLSLPTRLAQTFEHGGVVFRAYIRWAVAAKPVKGCGPYRSSLIERPFSFFRAPKLPKRCCQPSVRKRVLWKRADDALGDIGRGAVIVGKIGAHRD